MRRYLLPIVVALGVLGLQPAAEARAAGPRATGALVAQYNPQYQQQQWQYQQQLQQARLQQQRALLLTQVSVLLAMLGMFIALFARAAKARKEQQEREEAERRRRMGEPQPGGSPPASGSNP
jgi:hypothetical protein